MAQERGLSPRSLIKNLLSLKQQWTAPVEDWVRLIDEERHVAPRAGEAEYCPVRDGEETVTEEELGARTCRFHGPSFDVRVERPATLGSDERMTHQRRTPGERQHRRHVPDPARDNGVDRGTVSFELVEAVHSHRVTHLRYVVTGAATRS